MGQKREKKSTDGSDRVAVRYIIALPISSPPPFPPPTCQPGNSPSGTSETDTYFLKQIKELLANLNARPSLLLLWSRLEVSVDIRLNKTSMGEGERPLRLPSPLPPFLKACVKVPSLIERNRSPRKCVRCCCCC